MANIYNFLKQVFYLLLVLCVPVLLTAQPPTITYERAIGGLSAPVDIVNAGDGSNRLFIVQQAGIIQVWNGTTVSPFADLSPTGINVVNSGGERGLLSMAFHPDYDGTTNRFFFVYYTDAAGNIEVRRFQTTVGNPNTADMASGVSIINIPHPGASNHNGGKLNFGRDGYLYFGTGDGGGGNDGPNNAQNGNVLLGKMLRLNIDTTTTLYGNYGVPSTNPYIGDGDPGIDDRIWALGLRNPFRWSFDRLSDDMWIGDVGQGAQEEVNYRPRPISGHVNYGWRCFEGYPSTPGVPDCTPVDYVRPVFDYPNPASGQSAVTGGHVYRGPDYPNFWGYYVATDVYSGEIHILWPNGLGGFDSLTQASPLAFVVGFGEAEDGTLYAVSQQTDSAYKVVGTGGVILPVRLTSFIAAKKNGYNELKWVTESEINTARFYIEYSNDGVVFERIGTVAATRYTTGSSYRFNHSLYAFDRDMFYRLAIEDDNGMLRYSSILRLGGIQQNSIRIYPTVVHNGMFTLEIAQPAHSLRIINTNGSVVYKKSLEAIAGSMSVYLPATLAKGIYIVEITGDKISAKEKIIIQ
jgi:glucose/arabinose dehydrogenase